MFPMNQMPTRQIPFYPFINQMGRTAGVQNTGGFLSQLFGGGATKAGMNTLGSVNYLGGINGFFQNAQGIMKTIETIGPMVQQYSPVFRNVPAMFRIFKELRNLNVDDENPSTQNQPEKDPPISNSEIQEEESPTRESVPKLYI